MKYALIGCGRISPNHIAAAKANGLEIAALCDLAPGACAELARRFALPAETRSYLDYRELLAREKPELVAIATESGKHGAIALDCLEAGCNLIIEKPIALSLAEADAIIAKAEEKGLRVSACHQNRFNKSIQRIRAAREAGRFGRLYHAAAHVRWNRGAAYYEQAKWRGTWAMDGGALMNQCIHNIDLLRWMLDDEITEVVAMTDRLAHPYIEAEDLGLALLRTKNGAYGLVEGTVNVFPQNLEETLYLFGEKGTVKAGGKSVNVLEEWRFADGLDEAERVMRESSEQSPNVYGFGHTPLYADVIAALREGRRPYVSAEDGRAALELVLAIYLSSKEGRAVKLPLTSLASTDFTGLFER